jgi:uncharacterized membrane protein YjgN (DUF898 family)
MEQIEKAQTAKAPSTSAANKTVHAPQNQENPTPYDQLTTHEQQQLINTGLIIFAYIIFYYVYLPFVAIFGSLRYRVTHTRWRGIRGHVKGSSIVYGFVGFFHTLLKIITIGLWIPFADAMTYKYKMKRLYFGTQQANFNPEYGQLFVSHILTFCAGFALALILFFIIFVLVMTGAISSEGTQGSTASTVTYAILGVLAIVLFSAARYWYRARLVRMRYNNLTFGNIGFRCTITGWALLKQLWGNAFILMFTIGLGYPIVTQRRMKFFCKHVTMVGDIERTPILQAVGEKDKAGEGLSTMFDLSIGLF